MKNENDENKKVERRGGARPGAGRPKGSHNKVSAVDLLNEIYRRTGKSYEEILISDFVEATQSADRHLALKYHTMILNKVVADKVSIDIKESDEMIETRRQAFAEAVRLLAEKDQAQSQERVLTVPARVVIK